MNSKLKKIFSKIDKKTFNKYDFLKRHLKEIKSKRKTKFGKFLTFLKFYIKTKIYRSDSYPNKVRKLFKSVKIKLNKNDFYFYSLDKFKFIDSQCVLFGNCSPDYSIFINNSLLDLKTKLKNSKSYDAFVKIELIDITINYIYRINRKIKYSSNKQKNRIVNCLNNFINNKANTIFESLQRILLINQMLWQTGHTLIGSGRLDYILNHLSNLDKNISYDEEINLFAEFIKSLHSFYAFKSGIMLGDTGQIIILGGKNADDSYFSNKYTYLIIKALMKVNVPDPKILLRVSRNMPDNLLNLALESISTGIGSPLLSNDDVVINSLINFGYDKKDAYNYVTSACWEPIPANCFEQNNLRDINFLEPFNFINSYLSTKSFDTFDEFFNFYLSALKEHINDIVTDVNRWRWAKDPLLSLCLPYCFKTHKDISEGGAKYNNYGILSVGLANAINSIINIKKVVYEDKIMTYRKFNDIRINNYKDHDDLVKYLKNVRLPRFGEDNELVINLTKKVIEAASNALKDRTNYFGCEFKFGLSSPSYIMASQQSPASFDGRKENQPYATHISNDLSYSYTSLINFASSLDYKGNRFNGNVVDMMISPTLIKNDFDKILLFLKESIKKGFFQMQFNVVDSSTLIKAKADPNFMPNLIVRVWGFSAYFNDLPVEYKDLLISRALANEHKSI